MTWLLWILATGLGAIVLHDFVYLPIRRKYILWKVARKLRDVAKRAPDEIAEQVEECADLADKMRREGEQ